MAGTGKNPEPAGGGTLEIRKGSTLEIWGKEIVMPIKNQFAKTPWEFHLIQSEKPLCLPSGHEQQLLDIIKKWRDNFPKEPTLSWQQFGYPSLIARIDYVISSENTIFPYEVETSPAGIGLALKTIPGFKLKFQQLGWKRVVVVLRKEKRRKGGDDYLWTRVFDISEIPKETEYWIAPRIDDFTLDEYELIAKRSIWALRFRKSKVYGEPWLWKRLNNPEELYNVANIAANKWKWGGIVLKTDGSKSQCVCVVLFKREKREIIKWLPKTTFGTLSLGAAKKRIESTQWNPIFLQRFQPPLKVIVNGRREFGIFRIYVGLNSRTGEMRILGGWLNTRKSVIIHGASDAKFIPIIVP